MKSFTTTWGARRSGMTLMELMVSAMVLTILILAAGRIVTQAQKVVVTSEAVMQSNSRALAIANLLRGEMRRVSQYGFLCITVNPRAQVPNTTDSPMLIATLDGPVSPTQGGSPEMGAAVVIGQCTLGGSNTGIFHSKVVLNRSTGVDSYSSDMATLQKASRLEIASTAIAVSTTSLVGLATSATGAPQIYIPQQLAVPPASINEMNSLWQLLGANCAGLSIHWTPGPDTSGNMPWYGVSNNGMAAGMNSGWMNATAANSPQNYTEYNVGTASNPKYCALWTRHNLVLSSTGMTTAWPAAVRFRYMIQTPNAPDAEYEVICPVGR